MRLETSAALHFIAGYQRLLEEIHRRSGGEHQQRGLARLVAARAVAHRTPALLEAAASALEGAGTAVPADVLDAVRNLQLRQWVYLRDTTKYSVFICADAEQAFAVLGLSDEIRDVVGGTAVTFTAGVVAYRGCYVCDGLIESPLWLGANLKKEFSAALAHLKKRGRFRMAPAP